MEQPPKKEEPPRDHKVLTYMYTPIHTCVHGCCRQVRPLHPCPLHACSAAEWLARPAPAPLIILLLLIQRTNARTGRPPGLLPLLRRRASPGNGASLPSTTPLPSSSPPAPLISTPRPTTPPPLTTTAARPLPPGGQGAAGGGGGRGGRGLCGGAQGVVGALGGGQGEVPPVLPRGASLGVVWCGEVLIGREGVGWMERWEGAYVCVYICTHMRMRPCPVPSSIRLGKYRLTDATM